VNRFSVRDGQFWLNDRPLLLQAGEFHYFRTPAEHWEHRLGLLRGAGFNAVAAYIPWLWHQPQAGMTDLDGHSHPLRNLSGFLDLAARMDLLVIARPGPYIMAETINEGIPPWVFSQHPQAALIAQDGQPQHIASYLHPDFLRCVDAWYAAVFALLAPRQITRGGSIVMIQLDNEMGMLQWVRNLLDLNPDTQQRFAAWLRQQHGDALATRYPADDLPGLLRTQLTQPGPPHGARVLEDYRRFYRSYLREYTAWLWQRARAHGMDVPPVVNIHGFGNGGKTFPIGLSQLTDALAIDGVIGATDVYPIVIGEGNFHQLVLVNEMTRALHNPQQPLFSIEFQAGGNLDFGGGQSSLYDLHTRLCLSCGMRAINHYLFFDGENDPLLSPARRHDWGHPVRKDGTLRRHYPRYARLSRVLAAYGEALVRARPRTVTTLGFVLDDYMTEVNTTATRAASDVLTHQRDVVLFDLLARGLALSHRPFDALELSRAALDPANTPLLWVMMEKQCDEAVQRRLADYVRGGGRLVLAGRMCEETFDHTPCTLLRDALGITAVHSDPPFTPASIRIDDDPYVPVSFVERYHGDFDEVFASTADGQVVGFTRTVGRGRVLVLGAALAANTLDDLGIVQRMAARMGCAPLFELSDWADVRLSEGETGSFLYVSNYQDDPVSLTVRCADAPMLGGHAVALPARSGAILPLDWQVQPGVVVHYLTSEVTGVSAQDGRLTLTTAQPEFHAELSLSGYHCDDQLIVSRGDAQRVRLHGRQGEIVLTAG
jgi:beta-galactosidase